MIRFLAVLLFAGVVFADELKFENVRLVQSKLGQKRQEAKLVPGEEFWALYDIRGLKYDGIHASVKVSFKVAGPDGKVVLDQKGDEQAGDDIFAAHVMYGYLQIPFGPDSDLGKYKITLQVEDLLAKKTADTQIDVEVVKGDLGLLNARWSNDEAGENEHGPAMTEGEAPNLFCKIAGLSGKDGKGGVEVSFCVLDAAGKEVAKLEKMIDAEVGVGADAVPLHITVHFTHVGQFQVKVVVKDKVAGTETSTTLPVQVTSASR